VTSPHPHDGDGGRGRGYEARDIKSSSILAAGIGLALMIVVFGAVAWGVYRHLASRAASSSPPPNPLAAAHARQQPPTPRLQADPLRDLQEFRAHEDRWLDSYGWVDRKNAVIRIPIDRAVALLVARGLPTRSAPVAKDRNR